MKRYIALSVVGLIVACTEAEMPGPSEGAALFADNCAACHGTSATGDGPQIGDLPVKPSDLTRISARNGGTFPRAEVLSVIDGYSKGTHPNRIMPEFGLLLEGDIVPVDVDGVLTPTPRPLAALLAYLEDIQQ
ncbi:MAG: cytochrome c [Paracoccaceae bacterium]